MFKLVSEEMKEEKVSPELAEVPYYEGIGNMVIHPKKAASFRGSVISNSEIHMAPVAPQTLA